MHHITRNLLFVLLALACFQIPTRGQDTYNPEVVEFPAPIESVLTAVTEGRHGDFDGLVGAIVNSPGDALRVRLKIEGSGGTGGGGGAVISIEAQFAHNDDGRYELSLAGELMIFASGEVIQDVEAKAGAVPGGKVVFVFDTATEAVNALCGITLLNLGADLDRMVGDALQTVETLENAVGELRTRVETAKARVRSAQARVNRALNALNRVPGGRLFNAARSAALRVVARARNAFAGLRKQVSAARATLDLKGRALNAAKELHEKLVQFAGNRSGMYSLLKDHFAAIEISLFIKGEAEAKVGPEDLLFPGSSMQGTQNGFGVEAKYGAALRIMRGLNGTRHRIQMAVIYEIGATAEVALVAGAKVEGKLGWEYTQTFEIPTLDDIQNLVERTAQIAQQDPTEWPKEIAQLTIDYALYSLDLIRLKVKSDCSGLGTLSFIAGAGIAFGRETEIEFEGDDVITHVLTTMFTEIQATPLPEMNELPTLNEVLDLIRHVVTAPLRVLVEMKDTPATFAVQDRVEMGAMFMLGWSAANNGGAVTADAFWIDKGPKRSEKLAVSEGVIRILNNWGLSLPDSFLN